MMTMLFRRLIKKVDELYFLQKGTQYEKWSLVWNVIEMRRFCMTANEVYEITIRKFLNYTVSYTYVMKLIRQTVKSVSYILNTQYSK